MSIAVAPPAVMITMIVMQRHTPAFSIGRPVPGSRLRYIAAPAVSCRKHLALAKPQLTKRIEMTPTDDEPMLQFFAYGHLKPELSTVSNN